MIEVENIFKKHKVLIFIFVGISLISAAIAAFVQRGMYLDGALHFNVILDQLSQGKYAGFDDGSHHPRLFVNFINQFFVNFAYFVLAIKNKFMLSIAYTLPLFLLPLLALFWNYKLSERTKRYDIALWSLFVYSFVIIQSSIYSIVESSLAVILYFILLNYLVGKIDYTKKDAAIISVLVLFLFRSNEMVLFLGGMLFFASFYCAKPEEKPFNKSIKYFIGIGSLLSSIYMAYWFLTKPISDEAVRFVNEGLDYFPILFNLNVLLTVVGLFLALIALFVKNEFSKRGIAAISIVYILILNFMFGNLNVYLNPMMEGHLRTIPCWSVPLIFVIIFAYDFLKRRVSSVYLSNLLVIACIVGIAQTVWQINNSYWFFKDFEYLKSKLAQSKTILLNPDENQDLFDDSKYRRYKWKFSYFNDSLWLSDNYKVKTALTHSKSPDGCSEWLYRFDKDRLMVPTAVISIKNEFWDLTDVANKLEKQSKK